MVAPVLWRVSPNNHSSTCWHSKLPNSEFRFAHLWHQNLPGGLPVRVLFLLIPFEHRQILSKQEKLNSGQVKTRKT